MRAALTYLLACPEAAKKGTVAAITTSTPAEEPDLVVIGIQTHIRNEMEVAEHVLNARETLNLP